MSFRRKALDLARFVLFGVVGFLVLLGSTVEFGSRVFENDPHTTNPFLSLPMVFIGALMMLFGAGQWRRWAYLWVFLSIPISLWFLLLLPASASGKAVPAIVAGVAAFSAYYRVRAYYQRRGRSNMPEEVAPNK